MLYIPNERNITNIRRARNICFVVDRPRGKPKFPKIHGYLAKRAFNGRYYASQG
jgi:hypothetical protein